MGYRDEQSLLFRDETKKVVRKANAVTTQSRGPSSAVMKLDEVANLSDSSTTAAGVALDLTTQAHNQIAIRNQPILLDEQSACFFFQNFTHSGLKGKSRLDFLAPIYRQSSPGSALAEIIVSVGMAAMANKFKCPEMMFAARQKQTSVLRATNVALQDSVGARSDTTLLTVLLLSTFEIVSGSSTDSLDAWTHHVIGATAIAQIRGRKQLQTETGRRIFDYLRFQILIGCLQREIAVPQGMTDLSSIPMEAENEQERNKRRVFLILVRLCSLRSDFADETNDGLDFVDRALAIDADLENWADHLPFEYAYITRKSDKTDDGFLNYYHVYRDIYTCSLWNMYRCGRIMAHEVMLERVDNHSMTTVSPSVQRRRSEDMMARLSDDIAASVPFFLRGDHVGESSSYTLKAGVVGQMLIWPLYIIARTPRTSSLTRNWAVLQMERISQLTGVAHNEALASYMKKRRNVSV